MMLNSTQFAWHIPPLAEELLSRLPMKVGAELRKAFQADAEQYPVLEYFQKHTGIGVARANDSLGSLVRPGNRILELLYVWPATYRMLESSYGADAGDCGTIDRYLHGSYCGQALRARLAAVTGQTRVKVQELLDNQTDRPVLVSNLGSGPGRDTTAMLTSLDGQRARGGGRNQVL